MKPDENGDYVLGDMHMSADQYNEVYKNLRSRSGIFSAIAGDRYRWPKNELPYSLKLGKA